MDNIEGLALTLNSRMKDVTRASKSRGLEMGKILSGGRLEVDSFRDSIPKGDYMVNTNINLKYHGGLSAGDRVLVAWVGNDPIVICKIEES